MRYAIFPINPHKSYGITIGSRVKPDSEFREQVVSQIDRAMSSFDRHESQTHKVAIVPDWEPSEGGYPELPELRTQGQYLIFALLYSKEGASGELLSNQDLELYKTEIEGMFSEIFGETRAALVLLRDCSVSVIETDKANPWAGLNDISNVVNPEDIFPGSPWGDDRDILRKRWG